MNNPKAEDFEHRTAALTSWALFGSVGTCTVLSGFSQDAYQVSLAGYGILIIGFVAHLIINRIFGRGFRPGEIAAAFSIFGICILGLIAGWLFDPQFSTPDLISGIAGVSLVVLTFLVYVTTRFGLRGSFSMFHIADHS